MVDEATAVTEPTFISSSAELADAMTPTAKDAAQWAAEYWLRKNPRDVILPDGEKCGYFDNEKQAKRLNAALKEYIEAHGPLDVEGLPLLLTLQQSSTQTVDVQSLHEHNPLAFFRLLELGCLRVDMNALDAAEKAGLITGIPKMPIGQTPRLVFDKRPR